MVYIPFLRCFLDASNWQLHVVSLKTVPLAQCMSTKPCPSKCCLNMPGFPGTGCLLHTEIKQVRLVLKWLKVNYLATPKGSKCVFSQHPIYPWVNPCVRFRLLTKWDETHYRIQCRCILTVYLKPTCFLIIW